MGCIEKNLISSHIPQSNWPPQVLLYFILRNVFHKFIVEMMGSEWKFLLKKFLPFQFEHRGRVFPKVRTYLRQLT